MLNLTFLVLATEGHVEVSVVVILPFEDIGLVLLQQVFVVVVLVNGKQALHKGTVLESLSQVELVGAQNFVR